MTHEEIQSREIAESYVRGFLSEPERAAFEDHCFACSECFEQTELLQKFVDGVRDAAETGVLPEPRELAAAWWLRPAFLSACTACLVLAALTGWNTLVDRPRLQAEAARQRREAEAGRRQVAELGRNLAEAQLAMARVPSPEPNLPLVMLDASRADAASAVALPAGASQLAVWIEPPSSVPGTAYRLEISAAGGQAVETLDGLLRNPYGALAASLPAAKLTPGIYRARLYAIKGTKRDLAGDYHFEVRR